jgi:ubiquinone/menaquinone biosynthesis C-methylase UbiE
MTMEMYEQDEALVEEWQCRDPALTNVTDLVMDMLRPLSGRALDVGCGTGRVAARLAEQGFAVDALDIEEKVLNIARRVAARRDLSINFALCDFERENECFESEVYDVVVCMEVLEHVEQWQAVVDGMRRVLKPGGTLIISVPHDPAQFTAIDEYAGHYRRFHAADIVAALDGFQVRHLTTGFPFVRLITWAYTRMLRVTGRRHSPQKLWQRGSPYRSVGSRIMYYLDKVDNLFNRLNLGTTLVVEAKKPQ